jgi:cell division protein FtsL
VAATARAQPAPTRRTTPSSTPPHVTPRSRIRPRRRSTPLVAGGVAWIVLVAALLAGIVALNVAALRLNLEAQRLEDRKQELRAQNAAVASELSSLATAGRIEAAATEKLGLVAPVETTYVRVRPGER